MYVKQLLWWLARMLATIDGSMTGREKIATEF